MGENTKREDIEHFKCCLKDVQWYLKRLCHLNEEIAWREYEMTGLARSSVSLTKEQAKSSLPMPHYSGGGMSIMEKIYAKDLVQDEADDCRRHIMRCAAIDFLSHDQQMLLVDLFILRVRYEDKAAELGITRSALMRKVNSIIGKIV